MNFDKFKVRQWHDNRLVYRGLHTKEIVEMGLDNYFHYLTELQKRNYSYSEVKEKYNNQLTLI